MEKASRVTGADVMNEGIVVSFDDGRSARYTAALLLKMISEATEVVEPDPEDPDDSIGR